MIFEEVDKRTGRAHIVCSKYWPDRTRFRRRYGNKTLANAVLARLNAAIALGTWRELKKELTEGPEVDYTIEQFSKVYLEDYCRVQNTRPDFKEETLKVINRLVGARSVRRFTKNDVHFFKKERSKEVGNATVNRGLAVLSNLFTFAREKGIITDHPLLRYGKLPVQEKVRQILEPGDARRIVAETLALDYTVGAYLGIMGETGLRMTEALELKREFFDVKRRKLTVEASKDYKTRDVPLSAFAIELARGLPVVIGCPFLFVRVSTLAPLRAPRKEFVAGKKAAGVLWPGLHDFRHYRATQWLRHGVDIRTVKEWLGHKDIKTTMIYLRYLEGHAESRFREAEQRELQELAAPLAAGGK